MLKPCKQALVGLAVSSAAVVAMGSAAFAAHTVTPSSNLTDGQQVAVSISGLPSNSTGVVAQCNNDQGPAFDPIADCAFLSVLEKTIDVSGTGVINDFVVRKEPEGYAFGDVDWKCDPSGAADGSVTEPSPAGVSRVFSVCRIRVVAGTLQGTANESFQDITFAAAVPPTDVPEAPFAALLPAGALAVAAGGYLIVRNRKTASVA